MGGEPEWKMPPTTVTETLIRDHNCSIFLIPKPAESNELLRLHMSVSHSLRSTYAELASDITPDLPIVECEPLPTAILTAETSDDLLPTWVFADVCGTIQDCIINNNPWLSRTLN